MTLDPIPTSYHPHNPHPALRQTLEGYERAEHLGVAGSEQGRDIVVWCEGVLWAFQCKQVRNN